MRGQSPALPVLCAAWAGGLTNRSTRTLSVRKGEGLAQRVIDRHLAPLLKLADRHYIIASGHVVRQGEAQAR